MDQIHVETILWVLAKLNPMQTLDEYAKEVTARGYLINSMLSIYIFRLDACCHRPFGFRPMGRPVLQTVELFAYQSLL
jgi:predicted HD phosphohydrolase